MAFEVFELYGPFIEALRVQGQAIRKEQPYRKFSLKSEKVMIVETRTVMGGETAWLAICG